MSSPSAAGAGVNEHKHRFFLCPNCRQQVRICSHCDRGHAYCPACAPHVCQEARRRANRRYQRSPRGRQKNRARQRRHRQRRRKRVTDHGRPAVDYSGIVAPAVSLTAPAWIPVWGDLIPILAQLLAIWLAAAPGLYRCAFCGAQGEPAVRREVLARCRRRRISVPRAKEDP